jgi:hypothetical protein
MLVAGAKVGVVFLSCDSFIDEKGSLFRLILKFKALLSSSLV